MTPFERRQMPIELTEAQLESMADSEKLKWLIKIAFANYSELTKQGIILYGNGKAGLCEVSRNHTAMLKWFWIMSTGVAGTIVTILVYHIVR